MSIVANLPITAVEGHYQNFHIAVKSMEPFSHSSLLAANRRVFGEHDIICVT
jgi:hypothetical protein